MFKKIIPLVLFLLFIAMAGTAMAQEATDTTTAVDQQTIQATTSDETVTAQDLGVDEPTLLPDSKFYFLKNWQRAIQSVFTFGQVNKAELNLKIASEKLLEAQKLAEKTNNPAILNKATELYQNKIEAVQKNIAKFKETATTSQAVSKFLDKFTKQQMLQEQILDKLASQVPTSTLEKIQQVREKQLEQFGQVMQKLEDKNKIQARVQKGLDALKENDLKPLLNLQIIKKLEEKFPTSTIEQIQQVKTEALQNLNEKLQAMPAQAQQKIENYLDKAKTTLEKKQEILNEIKNNLPAGSTLKQKINIIKEDLRQNATATRKLGNDCVCTMNISPVCGADGKTYGNPCKAKCQNIAIVSQGPCKKPVIAPSPIYSDTKFFRGSFEVSGVALPSNPIKDFSSWLGQTKDVAFVIKPIGDALDVKINIVLPKKISLVEGSLTWSGEVKKDQEIKIPIKITLTEIGNYEVKALVNGKAIVSVENNEISNIAEKFYIVFFGNPSGQGVDNLSNTIEGATTSTVPTNNTSGQVPGSTPTITVPTNQ